MSGDKRPPAAPSDPEGDALWRQAMGQTQPLKGRRKTPRRARSVAPDVPPTAGRLSATPAADPATRSSTALPGRDIDRRNHQRLRRGKMPIEARLDLHGCTLARAHRLLDDFLAAAHRRGLRCVLVITGKGGTGAERGGIDAPFMRRAGGGVLRRHLPDWLNEGENRRRVLTLEPAQRRDGGSGAFYVLLRRRRIQD